MNRRSHLLVASCVHGFTGGGCQVYARSGARQFTELEPYTALVRPADDPRFPFLLKATPPQWRHWGLREQIMHRCRQRYYRSRPLVEERLARFLR